MKKRILLVVLVVVSFVLTTSCKKEPEVTAPTFDATTAKTEVEARAKVFVEALNSKDSVGLANCYTTDAKFMQPNAKTVEGRANIQKLFGMWMKGPMMHIMIKTVEVWGDENMLAAEPIGYTSIENFKTYLDKGVSNYKTGKFEKTLSCAR